MSSNGETGVVLRGVTHGAVDFLIKPVRVEELRNVWQHVVRKRKGDAVRSKAGICMTPGLTGGRPLRGPGDAGREVLPAQHDGKSCSQLSSKLQMHRPRHALMFCIWSMQRG